MVRRRDHGSGEPDDRDPIEVELFDEEADETSADASEHVESGSDRLGAALAKVPFPLRIAAAVAVSAALVVAILSGPAAPRHAPIDPYPTAVSVGLTDIALSIPAGQDHAVLSLTLKNATRSDVNVLAATVTAGDLRVAYTTGWPAGPVNALTQSTIAIPMKFDCTPRLLAPSSIGIYVSITATQIATVRNFQSFPFPTGLWDTFTAASDAYCRAGQAFYLAADDAREGPGDVPKSGAFSLQFRLLNEGSAGLGIDAFVIRQDGVDITMTPEPPFQIAAGGVQSVTLNARVTNCSSALLRFSSGTAITAEITYHEYPGASYLEMPFDLLKQEIVNACP
jgi:hypothetical protein